SLAYCSHSLSCAPDTRQLYALSLHDALPILLERNRVHRCAQDFGIGFERPAHDARRTDQLQIGVNVGQVQHQKGLPLELHQIVRSEEHTSELQSRENLVCRLLLKKKKARNVQQGKNKRANVWIMLIKVNSIR